MASILLTTLNAKYIHTAFGLRYLHANLGALRTEAQILEFNINQRPGDIVEALLFEAPKIIGIGIYIWNVTESLEVVTMLKLIRPDIVVILGGPEVSFETESQPIVHAADYVITGEADLTFVEVCRQLLGGQPPTTKVIHSPVPDLNQLALPYDLYDAPDLAQRIIYVEASRGCPFTCEFCLSSLDVPVRQFPLPALLTQLQTLFDRGLQQFKFVDRTFNLNLNTSKTLLEFFLERYRPGLFLHFEMVPDRLPEGLREIISRFPPGALQFEVGIQTFNEEVAARIRRRQNYQKLEENFRFLRQNTHVHIHADLIAGLPGETWESFGRGFDRLIALNPQEIQVGILKRLRGTPIVRHDTEWKMIYNPFPPYEIVRHSVMDYSEFQRLRRFSRYWDLVANSGNFVESTPLLWKNQPSPFSVFAQLSEWLFQQVGRGHSISLSHLAELLFRFLTECQNILAPEAALTLWRDYQRGGRSDKPIFLRPYLSNETPMPSSARLTPGPKRQARHLTVELNPMPPRS